MQERFLAHLRYAAMTLRVRSRYNAKKLDRSAMAAWRIELDICGRDVEEESVGTTGDEGEEETRDASSKRTSELAGWGAEGGWNGYAEGRWPDETPKCSTFVPRQLSHPLRTKIRLKIRLTCIRAISNSSDLTDSYAVRPE